MIDFLQIFQQKLNTIPKKTGCYLFKNSQNQVVYVGKAKNIQQRIVSHLQKKNILDEKKNRFLTVIKS